MIDQREKPRQKQFSSSGKEVNEGVVTAQFPHDEPAKQGIQHRAKNIKNVILPITIGMSESDHAENRKHGGKIPEVSTILFIQTCSQSDKKQLVKPARNRVVENIVGG